MYIAMYIQRGRFLAEELAEAASFDNVYSWWTVMHPYREICKVAKVVLSLSASVAATDYYRYAVLCFIV